MNKMKAYLIYYPEEAVKNQGFIELFREAGAEFGIDFSYVSYEDYQEKELPDFVLNRTRDALVSSWYEERGVKALHSARITEIGNDKWKTLAFLQERLPKKILEQRWVPQTILLSKEKLSEWIELFSHAVYEAKAEFMDGGCNLPAEFEAFIRTKKDFVIKSVSGHGGSEVMAFSSPKKFMTEVEKKQYWGAFLEQIRELAGKDCMIQELIPSESKDVRVYILGNQIYQGILRQGQKDFRSNFSLGGKTEVYHFSEEEEQFIHAFLEAFNGEVLGLAGLDFIVTSDGKLVFNELEEMVGCRMLYQNTERNIVRDYVKWLVETGIGE